MAKTALTASRVPNTTRWLTPEEGLAAHDAAAALLAAVLREMPAEARGSHGQPTDAEEFAAMHCDLDDAAVV
ncbi:MAG TPA: hypothetical protein VLQ80_04560 [Candidatus Saccharimonadia bacterium]|nr:hypothetical protein [Candidatus Saccharimonadia bacterium]